MRAKKEDKDKSFLRLSIENFWYYYKWPFLGGIVIFFVVLFVAASWTEVEEPSDVHVVATFARPLTTQEFEFQSCLSDVVTDTDGDGEIRIKTEGIYISENGKGDSDEIAKSDFEVAIGYARGDLMLLDGTNMERFGAKDFLIPLEEYMDISEVAEEDLFRRNGVAVAVRLQDSQVLLDKGFIIDKVYAGVMYIPDGAQESVRARRDNAVRMIEKLRIPAENIPQMEEIEE